MKISKLVVKTLRILLLSVAPNVFVIGSMLYVIVRDCLVISAYAFNVDLEGELRSYSISVEQIKQNNYRITLPSQHIDTTCVWIMAKSKPGDDAYLSTQWYNT